MTMRRFLVVALTAIVAVQCRAAAPAPADDGIPLAVGLRLGTLGAGAEVAVGLGDYVNLRAVGHMGGFSLFGSFSDVDYDVAVDFTNVGLILDLHAADGGFRWSAGIFYNGNDYDGTATPLGPTTIGGVQFSPSQIGTITGEIQTDSMAYYFGVGFGNPVSRDGRWTVTLDLGVWLLASDPTIELTADGSASGSAEFQRELEEEELEVEDELIRWWPVIALGISYRF